MSKGKDFRGPRKRGFDDDGPSPSTARAHVSPAPPVFRPSAHGRRFRRRFRPSALGRARRQFRRRRGEMVQVATRASALSNCPTARATPSSTSARCSRPATRTCPRAPSSRFWSPMASRASRSPACSKSTPPAPPSARRSARSAVAAPPAAPRARPVQRRGSPGRGQVVRRRQGLRLRPGQRRRQGRVRPYLHPRPGRHFGLAEGQPVTMKVVDTQKGREAVAISLA